MKILHIACVNNDLCSGVDVVVPEHVRAQSRLADVCLLNVTNKRAKGVARQYAYGKELRLDGIAPDLAVFHEAYRIEYLGLARELKRKNIPYIIIPHGELSREAQKKKRLKKWAANLLLFNRFIENAAALQMLSQRELESTRHGRIKFVGTNGISIPERRKESFNKDKTAFVYIGRLDPYHKGLDLMLDGVKLCADDMRKRGCTLDIYGPDRNGDGARLVKMINERRLSNIVSLHPAVSGREKENALLSADVFIQTSRFEGMPMGILEALGYGLPCLLSDGTTLASLVDDSDAGWRCRGDAESIADAIKRAIAERQSCAAISDNARALAIENFSWDTVAADTLKSYERIIGEKK